MRVFAFFYGKFRSSRQILDKRYVFILLAITYVSNKVEEVIRKMDVPERIESQHEDYFLSFKIRCL